MFEPDVLASLLRQWSRSLRARNRSPRTVETYTDSAQELAACAFARRHGHEELDRALIEDYLADQAARWKPAMLAFRYRSLQQFTKWLTAEDELPGDPMAGMQVPKVLDLGAGAGAVTRSAHGAAGRVQRSGFNERRDTAIVRLLPYTAMRLAEMTGLTVPDLNMDHEVAVS